MTDAEKTKLVMIMLHGRWRVMSIITQQADEFMKQVADELGYVLTSDKR